MLIQVYCNEDFTKSCLDSQHQQAIQFSLVREDFVALFYIFGKHKKQSFAQQSSSPSTSAILSQKNDGWNYLDFNSMLASL